MKMNTFKKLIAFPRGTEEKVMVYAEKHNLNFTQAVLAMVENASAEENTDTDTFTWISDFGMPDFIATSEQHELLTVCKAHGGVGNETSCSAIMKDLGTRTTAAKVYERLDELRGKIAIKNLGSGRLEIVMISIYKK